MAMTLRRGDGGRIVTLLLLLLGVAALAVGVVAFVAPIKSVYLPMPLAAHDPVAKAASEEFWRVFHEDRYEELPGVLERLAAGHQRDQQPLMTNLLGAAHLWRFQERRRVGRPAPDLREDLVRAAEFADMSLAANPKNTFAPAIRVTARWQLAVLDQKPQDLPEIELEILENSQRDPHFHAFVQGWLLSAMLPVDSPRFAEAPDGFRLLNDACAGFEVPADQKFNALVFAYLAIKSWATIRLCYNNPVAPHNLEGTFLASADAYVKMGRFDEARIWYGNAQAAPTYATWRYRDVVERRLAGDFETLRAKFVADTGKLDVVEPAMSFQSTMGCASCHAR
jgi:tetratricopeptide (TPR) repeat protein